METTIKVSNEVKRHLDRMKIFERETYNDVIEVLIEDNLELNEKTKRELAERIKNPRLVSHEEVRKRLGL
jgi:predicted CopG family antitoxin